MSNNVEQIAFGHDTEGARRRQGAALVAVELVAMITVNDDLSVEPAREFETVEKHVARIVVTVGRILVLPSGGRPTSELDPSARLADRQQARQ